MKRLLSYLLSAALILTVSGCGSSRDIVEREIQDIHIYPKSDMAAGTMRLAQGVGGQKVSFPGAVEAEDDIALLAESRECTRNGAAFQKEGFYQYSTAWDSKHKVALESGKTAKLLFTMQEMQEGGGTF